MKWARFSHTDSEGRSNNSVPVSAVMSLASGLGVPLMIIDKQFSPKGLPIYVFNFWMHMNSFSFYIFIPVV